MDSFLKRDKISKLIEPLTIFDLLVFGLLSLICFFTFQQGDILHTGGSSIAYLKGHILDFYDYNKPFMKVNNYLPSTYILFAIWNIPVYILGMIKEPTQNVSTAVLMWYKLLPVMVYMVSSLVLYKIAIEIGLGKIKAKLCSYVFLTTPIGFFSQFIFGQYDIFTVFMVLVGLYYYYKKDNFKFTLFFGLAITFKYFALFIFIPMLLLREKNILKLIKLFIYAVIPFAIEVAVYIHSTAFKQGIFGFGAAGYILIPSIDLTHTQIRIFVVLWMLVCGWAYFIDVKDKNNEIKWGLYLSNIVNYLLFGLSFWHPQWVLFAVPFWVLNTFISKKSEIFLLTDVLAMLFFIAFTVNTFPHNVDQDLFNLGIFGKYTIGVIGNHLKMPDLFIIKDRALLFSFFSSILLINVVFKHPKFCLDNLNESFENGLNWIRARFILGLSIFLIPAFISFIACFVYPQPIFTIPAQKMTIIEAVFNDRQVEQVFTATRSTINEVNVQFGTYVRVNHSQLKMIIEDKATKLQLYSTNIDVPRIVDNAITKIKVPDIAVQKGKEYGIKFVASGTSTTDFVTIYRTEQNLNESSGYAIVDGTKQKYNLNVQVFGK